MPKAWQRFYSTTAASQSLGISYAERPKRVIHSTYDLGVVTRCLHHARHLSVRLGPCVGDRQTAKRDTRRSSITFANANGTNSLIAARELADRRRSA
jgi:hypothetical protein